MLFLTVTCYGCLICYLILILVNWYGLYVCVLNGLVDGLVFSVLCYIGESVVLIVDTLHHYEFELLLT